LAEASRYHYLAQALLAVTVALVAHEMIRRHPWTAFGLGVWMAGAVGATVVHGPPVPLRGVAEGWRVAQTRAHIEHAVRSIPVGSTACVPVEPAPIAFDFPGSLGVYLLYYADDDFEGRHVRFVSSDPKLLALREAHPRVRRLLLPEGDCPTTRDGDH
jgi:hypothetical protein